MLNFAQKQKQHHKRVTFSSFRPDVTASKPVYHEHPVHHFQPTAGNQTVQLIPKTDAEEIKAGSSCSSSHCLGHDFSRVRIYSPLEGAVQTKMKINNPGDEYEQEADRISEDVMQTHELRPQRACTHGGACPMHQTVQRAGHVNKSIYIKPVGSGHRKQTEVLPIVHEGLHSPGQPLNRDTLTFMEQRFGRDFGKVRVHVNEKAADSARAINARAFAYGQNLVFGAGEYQPASAAGGRLLAHELTHVVQQFGTSNLLQRQDKGPTASPLHVGIIPVREFIRHVETVERAYPTKSPQEILTMIRSLYYGSPAGSPGFDRLIPDAPSTGAVEMCTDSEGRNCEESVGTCICVYAQGLAMGVDQLRQAISRLRQHANENEIADNPSPYIQVAADLIDVGHLLVGVDAILHPRTDDPFRAHGLTSAPGPATWEGDVGAGMVYLAEHITNGHKSGDVKGKPSPTVQSYYHNSAPMSDILGDLDAFGMASMVGPQTLSTALRYYYLSESGGSPRYQFNRWAGFCTAVGLVYRQNGGTISWTQAARQLVIDRIVAFANLFHGRTRPIDAMVLGIKPRSWPEAGNFADLFLADIKLRLEQEIAAHTR